MPRRRWLKSRKQLWLPPLVDDTLAQPKMLAIGSIAIGVVLLIVSFIYKRHPAQTQANPIIYLLNLLDQICYAIPKRSQIKT